VTRDLDELLRQLTFDEKVRLTCGADDWSTHPVERLGVPAVRMTDGPNGARGLALAADAGSTETPRAMCVPCGSALGATWDPVLVEEIGALLGAEARRRSCRILLAPTVNLHRSPLGGRTFESYSEDPLLTGRLAAAFVRGVQSQRVVATVKHLAGNESEDERMTADSIVDERSLRELYLRPFEIAVCDSGARAVMTAYNRLNGSYPADSRWLLHDVVRAEWGFEGMFVTDWYASGDTRAAALAGLNLEMPAPARIFGEHLTAAVATHELGEDAVDEVVRPLLRTLEWLGILDDADVDVDDSRESVEGPEDRALARRAASDAIVLLANDGTLPLASDQLTSVAVVGPNAATTTILGGGSAQVAAHRQVSVLDGLRAAVGGDVQILHEPGVDTDRYLPVLDDVPFTLHLYRGHDLVGPPVETRVHPNSDIWFLGSPSRALPAGYSFRATGRFVPPTSGRWLVSLAQAGSSRLLLGGEVVLDGTGGLPPGPAFLGTGSDEIRTTVELVAGRPVELVVEYDNAGDAEVGGARVGARLDDGDERLERAVRAAAAADAVVVVVGTTAEWELEGNDRPSLSLPGHQDELVERVLDVQPSAVVVVNSGAPVAMPWVERVRSLLHVWFGGQEAGHAVADVLLGESEPAGRLPTSFPWRIEHTAAFGNFPAENGLIRYGEGLLVGYRHHDTRDREPLFPFGHGGSYTTFSVGPPRLSSTTIAQGGTIAIEVEVTNTGYRRGAEVVQCYVAPVAPRRFRPVQELEAFAKVWLDPGESSKITLVLDRRSFASWDPGDRFEPDRSRAVGAWQTASREPSGRRGPPGWFVDPGPYEIRISRSSRQPLHRAVVEAEGGPP
jgi:beta-glucosidase